MTIRYLFLFCVISLELKLLINEEEGTFSALHILAGSCNFYCGVNNSLFKRMIELRVCLN